MYRRMLKNSLIFFLLLGPSSTSFAGLLLAPNISWSSYSFRPLAEEDTPNYYGYGFGLTAGYSVAQVIDVAAFYQYHPGNLKHADPSDSNSELKIFGGLAGLRLYKTIYFALSVGSTDYRLPVIAKSSEVQGNWNGLGFGFSLGGIMEISDNFAWQIAMNATTINMTDISGQVSGERTLDLFSLSISLVYNSYDALGFVDALFSRSISKLFRN